ncbi:MAG TPA: AMP-binding protein, partial [Methylomirabilota bacterium]|nr:AMP-binding protein [Methylomirabilota bacterium]
TIARTRGPGDGAGPDVATVTADELAAGARGADGGAAGGGDLAFVQYSSGSTTAPRGVALSHANVLAGIEAIARGMQATRDDVCWLWIPLFHDMGLVSTLTGLAVGYAQALWPPVAFVGRPDRWFREFAAARATIYVGPNFSYEYLLAAVEDDVLERADLSGWRIAFNGAELIDARGMLRFLERFGRAGFRPEAMRPVYGLAEATLAVTFPEIGAAPVVHWVDRDVLARERRVAAVPPEHPAARGVVGVGRAVFGHEVRVADEAGTVLGEGRVGEVQVRGPAVMRAYYRAPAATRAAFVGGWLRTGDLGYAAGGQLFIVGRLKEVLVVRGRKLHPEDVETVVRDVPGVYRRRCVAFPNTWDGAERIGVAVETRLRAPAQRAELHAAIRARVGTELGAGDCEVYLLGPRSILRTSSGKVRRLGTGAAIHTGALASGPSPCVPAKGEDDAQL